MILGGAFFNAICFGVESVVRRQVNNAAARKIAPVL